jgi:signal transduction histidine kinase
VIVELADTTHHQRITRENALLAQLGGSRAMVRQLAHEIKNPLGGLRGAAQLLERQLKDVALHEYTTVIIAEADRLAALVDALLGPVRRRARSRSTSTKSCSTSAPAGRGSADGVTHRARLRSEPAAAAARPQPDHPGSC